MIPNLELNINALKQEVFSGKKSIFELDVRVRESQTILKNRKIVVNLPKNTGISANYPKIQNGVPDKTLTIVRVGGEPTPTDSGG